MLFDCHMKGVFEEIEKLTKLRTGYLTITVDQLSDMSSIVLEVYYFQNTHVVTSIKPRPI